MVDIRVESPIKSGLRFTNENILAIFITCGKAYACSSNSIPVHLLGKNAYENEINFKEFLAQINVEPSPDSELLPGNSLRETWFIIDKSRNYFWLGVSSGIIDNITIQDKCLITSEGIKIGDSMAKVMKVYPDAKFRADSEDVAKGVYDIVANEGALVFWFDSRDIRKRLSMGEDITPDQEIVKTMKVSLINILLR